MLRRIFNMKLTKALTFWICLISCLTLFTGYSPNCYAQGKEQRARKFDEYKLGVNILHDDSTRLARFAKQLNLEPLTKAYIIAYTPRRLNVYGSSYWDIAENRLLTAKAELAHHYDVKESRIITVDGGVREDTTVELWILPVGATPPQPHPEFQLSNVINCYPVRVDGDIYVLRRDEPLKFSAAFNLETPTQVTFQWTISSGKIISGQGTETITVDVSANAEKRVTATVEVKGLSEECRNKASYTTVVGVTPYKLSEFEENYSEALQIRLDELAMILQKEPLLQGYIIVYGGRTGQRNYTMARAYRAKDYLVNARGMNPDRFSINIGGYRENPMFEIWLLSNGMSPPIATPTVDEKYVKFTSQTNVHRKQIRRRR